MKLVHTRTNQLRYFSTGRNYQDRVYKFGVFYDSERLWDRLEYNYQFKDSFSMHLMSLITDDSLGVNRIIALLNYHNCLYYNHTKFGLDHFASYKTLYGKIQNKPLNLLNHIFGVLVWDYNLNCNINFTFNLGLNGVYVNTNSLLNKMYKIIDFANQDLINMIYEIAQQNKKIEKKLTFMLIYNLLLR